MDSRAAQPARYSSGPALRNVTRRYDLHVLAAAQSHAAIQRAKSESSVERFEVGVATDIDHVEVFELREESLHEFGSDSTTLV